MKLGPFTLSFDRKHRGRTEEFAYRGRGIGSVADLILQLEALLSSSSTNRYVDRATQVAESVRKYQGRAIKGNLLTKNVINTRAAFTAARGLVYAGDPGSPEAQFAKAFFKRNRLDLGFLRSITRERCFEGQVLLTLNSGAGGVPSVRFISWLDTSYEVKANPIDYGAVEGVSYPNPDRAGPVSLSLDRIAFMKFDCRMNALEGTPLLAGVLNNIEDIEDAIATWRALNVKFTNPTAYFKFDDENDANAFLNTLKGMNDGSGWKWGDPLAGAGEGSVLQMGYGPYTSVETELLMRLKLLSGHVGVPVQYIGFVDLLTSKATAQDVSEALVLISEVEQREWEAGFSDLLGRAMSWHNRARGAQLDARKSDVRMELINEVQFRRVRETWLPLYLNGAITLETFLSKVPEVDETEEAPKVRDEIRKNGGTPLELRKLRLMPARGETAA
ncbi:MAG TPA: hypothetical protein VFQ92_12540 [Blastocatellia bacterium]|nr:hypothetical protein [Blastocatellia bacterium]